MDVEGYFTDAESAGDTRLYRHVTPRRLLGGAEPALLKGGTHTLTATGGGVPTDARAVVLNVTPHAPHSHGSYTVYPAGTSTLPPAVAHFAVGAVRSRRRAAPGEREDHHPQQRRDAPCGQSACSPPITPPRPDR